MTRERLPAAARAAPRLAGIQALRGVASVAVVLYHAARHTDKASHTPGLMRVFQSGHAGVDLFFAISGFIILFVHHGDIGRPARLGRYANHRFSRVMPLYWVALALTLALAWPGHGLPGLGWTAWNAALLPSVREPLMGHAWTLQFEVVFYCAFAVLILHRAAGLALLACWLGWIAATGFGIGGGGGVPSALCGAYAMEFFMGMTAAWLVRRGWVRRPRLVAGVGLALFAAAMVLESLHLLDGQAAYARFAFGLPAAAAVAGLAAAEMMRPLAVPGWLLRLGEASYAIYLFQFVFIGVAWQAWRHAGLEGRGPPVLCFATLAAAGIAGGIAMSALVDRPLLRQTRRLLAAARPAPPVQTEPAT